MACMLSRYLRRGSSSSACTVRAKFITSPISNFFCLVVQVGSCPLMAWIISFSESVMQDLSALISERKLQSELRVINVGKIYIPFLPR